MSFTPGPWKVCEGDDTVRAEQWGKSDQMGDYRGVIVCSTEIGHGGRPHAFAEAQANARLIAAAPDLLEAAKATLEAIESWHNFHNHPTAIVQCDDICEQMPRLKASIAKAEGETR